VTGLPSIALPVPEFSTAIDVTGIHDIQFDSNGKAYAIFGLGSSPEQRDQVLKVPEFGQLVAIDNLNGQASLTKLADLAEYEGLFNPDNNNSGFFNPYNDGIDSNPYAFLIKDDTAYIVDAAGNTFFKAKTDGSEFTLLSIFPERPIT
ncbi:MAG: ScyD/ScyE family protein, partial [Microcystis sp.]